MKKSMIFFLFIIFIIISGCGTRIHLYSRNEFLERVNLIENSGFEIAHDMGTELPDGWIVLNDYDNNIFIDDQIAHSGQKSLKIKEPNSKINLTSDSFNVDPSCSYYCRCFIKANKPGKDPVVFYFFTFDSGSNQVNRFSKRVYPSENWTEVEITTDEMNMSSAFGRVVLSIPQGSDINLWVDDMESYTICNTE